MKTLLGAFWRHFRWIAAVATAAGIAIALLAQRDAVARVDWTLSWRVVALSVLAFAAAPLVQGFTFWLILRLLGTRTPAAEAMLIWSRSFLLRYAPSGALAIVVRVRARERLEATRDQVLVATAYEQLAALLAGAIASVAAFVAAGLRPHWLAYAIGLPALVVAIVLRPAFGGRLVHAFLASRNLAVPRILRGRHLALATAVNGVGWLATGAGAYVLIEGLEQSRHVSFLWVTAVYALAWLAGFVIPALPGGLGARDGTLVALLATRLGAGVGSVLAISVRLANTLGEFVAIGLVELAYLAWKRATSRASQIPRSPRTGW